MSFIQSIILGIIQGLTEFLPISSSAHLVLVPYLFKWNIPESQVFPFDVLVQIGTLVAVIVYFWKDLWTILKAFFNGLVKRKPFADANSRMGWYLILATIPAGLAGVLLKDKVEAAFNSPKLTAVFLLLTALLLLGAEFFSRRNRKMEGIGWKDALWIGGFQALSIFPGISRSGSSMTGGMTRNLDRPSAARFSFLMSIPVMVAAGIMSVVDLFKVPGLASFLPKILIGFLAALVVGYLSIRWLLSFLTKHSLVYFAAYCVLLAAIVLIVAGVRKDQTLAVPLDASATPVEQVVLQTPVSGLKVVNVDYTASLDWLTPSMAACAKEVSEISLVTNQVTASQVDLREDGVLLLWGEPADSTGSVFQVGTDTLAIVVNPANPLMTITPEVSRLLFSGLVKTWGDLYTECPDCFSAAPGKELASEKPGLGFYSGEDNIQQLFEKVVMGGTPVAVSSNPVIPSVLAMHQYVAETPASIGFLPALAVNESIRLVTLEGIESSTLSMPILAVTTDAPEGQALQWLGCLQNALND